MNSLEIEEKLAKILTQFLKSEKFILKSFECCKYSFKYKLLMYDYPIYAEKNNNNLNKMTSIY